MPLKWSLPGWIRERLISPSGRSRRVQSAYATASLKIGEKGNRLTTPSVLPSEEGSDREVMASAKSAIGVSKTLNNGQFSYSTERTVFWSVGAPIRRSKANPCKPRCGQAQFSRGKAEIICEDNHISDSKAPGPVFGKGLSPDVWSCVR
jgi:hypothetical protein